MILAPLLLSLLQTPAATSPTSAPPTVPTGPRHPRRLFISPMGEPFRARTRDEDTLADWFEQADTNHDGRLTIEEMQQDADRLFALLDVNHDGEIDPDEITRYEDIIAPEVRTGEHFSLELDNGAEEGETTRSGEHGQSDHRRAEAGKRKPSPRFVRAGGDTHQGAARFGLLDLPEPVVSADTDFDRGVSRAEFRQAAVQRFLALDLDHRGYLTLADLERIRPAPPAAPNAPDRNRETDESAPPN